MQRREFVKKCCIGATAIPLTTTGLLSCTTLYYAQTESTQKGIKIPKSEFIIEKKNKTRNFVLAKTDKYNFPICISGNDNEGYTSVLLKCTHRGCELIVGGGIYACPCHGSEFTMQGDVLQGPAINHLLTFKNSFDDKYIYLDI